jgi:hypothetical protein
VVRAEFEDVGDGRVGVGMRKRELRSLDLGQQVPGDGEVDAAELAGHRLGGLGMGCDFGSPTRSAEYFRVVAVHPGELDDCPTRLRLPDPE